jgi:hypothetical protein
MDLLLLKVWKFRRMVLICLMREMVLKKELQILWFQLLCLS